MSKKEETEAQEETKDWSESLTPREADVLRKRFGIIEESKNDFSTSVPPNEDEGNGSGGVPAPAKPPN